MKKAITKRRKQKHTEKKVQPSGGSSNVKRVGIKQFAEDTRHELDKVAWPTAPIVKGASIVILAIVILSTLFIGGVDVLLAKAFFWINQQ